MPLTRLALVGSVSWLALGGGSSGMSRAAPAPTLTRVFLGDDTARLMGANAARLMGAEAARSALRSFSNLSFPSWIMSLSMAMMSILPSLSFLMIRLTVFSSSLLSRTVSAMFLSMSCVPFVFL